MADLNLLCLTCFSNIDDGGSVSESMREFLLNDLNFKIPVEELSTRLICPTCYKNLIDLRRFCSQLRDVEFYYENKLNDFECIDEKDPIPTVERIEKVFAEECVSFPDIDQDLPTDPILVEATPVASEENSTSIEVDTKRPKRQKRFAHSSSVSHSNRTKDLTINEKRHKRRPPICCFKCNSSFPTAEALRDHKLMHIKVQTCQCQICHKQYLNQPSLEAHIKLIHKDLNSTTTSPG